jgi:DNA processing protein
MVNSVRELLLALNEIHQGDWKLVIDQIEAHAFPEKELVEKAVSKVTDNYITILDESYPEILKQSYHMPLVVYYRGDINLLGSKDYKRLSVICSRECDLKLLDKAINDIAVLPDDVVLVTTNEQIIANCVRGAGKKKIILIKSCGLDQKLPNHLSYYENAIVANGGLIISRYPAEKLPEQYNFIESKFITSGICDAVLVVKVAEKGSDVILISQHLAMGREIMVYPTFPKWDGAINNTLISEGAILVEDADDIKREIYNN